MAEYAGSAMALSWINSAITAAGTLLMAPESRSFTLGANQSVIDTTAGSDANQQNIASFVTYSPSWEGVAQDGTAGTVYAQSLKAGTQGTLIYGPSGTVAGAIKYTIPAFSLGLSTSSPYADVTTYSCDFQVSSGGVVTITNY
jgi:hypothetical protein